MITEFKSSYRLVSDEQLKELRAREDELFVKRTPKSKEVYDNAYENLHNGVPMPWFNDWGTKHPVFLEMAKNSTMVDIDGNEYVDFCFGDTGV